MDLREKMENLTDLDRQILTASKEEFETKGYYRANIDLIAEKLEIGKGTVYRHFGSKMFLFASVLIDLFMKASLYLNEVREIKDVNQALDLFFDRLIETTKKGHLMKEASSPEDMRIFSQEMGANPQLGKVMEQMCEMRDAIALVLSDILQRGVEQKLFKADLPMPQTAGIIIGVIGSHVMHGFPSKSHSGKDSCSKQDANLVEIRKFILRSITNEQK